jgi:hypothetical protein
MGKNNDKLDRVPPYIPIIWRDWRSSPSIRRMTPTQRAIFLDILIEEWVYGGFPRDAWALSKQIGAVYRTTLKLLTDYSHLFLCSECGGSWTQVDCQCGVSKDSALCHNPKLENLRNDVDSGLSLGTTKPNSTKPNRRKPELAPAALEVQEEGQQPGQEQPNAVSSREPRPVPASVPNQTPKPTATAFADGSLVNTYLHCLGKAKLDGITSDYWNTVFEKLVTLHGESHVRNVLAYCFSNPMYARGAKTTKTDKADWFAEKFDELAEHITADEEFESRRRQKAAAAKIPDNASEYRKNPTGREFLKPSDL